MRRPALAAALLLGMAAPLRAQQGLSFDVGRLLEGGGWSTYRLSYDRALLGPIGGRLIGTVLNGPTAIDQRLYGAGAELTLFRDGAGPYAVGGVAGGFGSGTSGSSWGSWSAGLGYQVRLAPWAALTGEGRWRRLSFQHREGVELSLGLGFSFGGRGPVERRPVVTTDTSTRRRDDAYAPPLATGGAARPAPATSPAARPETAIAPAAPAALKIDSVVATATDVMGRRYQFGGTGEGDEGFDCSGLIQYAYAKHGVPLPRRSVEQAKEGRPVERRVDALRPGDILTFSNRGTRVTHVGLYIGDGRFIHSATRGVQTSQLSAEDPYGRWWWKRWVGARRVVE